MSQNTFELHPQHDIFLLKPHAVSESINQSLKHTRLTLSQFLQYLKTAIDIEFFLLAIGYSEILGAEDTHFFAMQSSEFLSCLPLQLVQFNAKDAVDKLFPHEAPSLLHEQRLNIL
jgi:hypothetical protein